MSFIWNGEIPKYVDLDEEWDKTEFVVARKLFVEINDESSGGGIDEVIRGVHQLALKYYFLNPI